MTAILKEMSILVMASSISLSGCSGPSQRELTAIKDQMKDLTIFPDASPSLPQFRPGANLTLDNVRIGAQEGVETACDGAPAPVSFPLMPAVYVQGAVAGALDGAFQGSPDSVCSHIECVLYEAIGHIDTNRRIAEVVAAHYSEKRVGLRSEIMQRALDSKPGNAGRTRELYQDLHAQGKQTVLQIRVTDFGLKGGKGENPSARFYAVVQAALVRAADGKTLCRRQFKYEGKASPFDEWCKEDGLPLRTELELVCVNFGNRIFQAMLDLQQAPDGTSQEARFAGRLLTRNEE